MAIIINNNIKYPVIYVDNTWSGNQAEYDALVEKDPATFYYIIDAKKIIKNNVEYSTGGGLNAVELQVISSTYTTT